MSIYEFTIIQTQHFHPLLLTRFVVSIDVLFDNPLIVGVSLAIQSVTIEGLPQLM